MASRKKPRIHWAAESMKGGGVEAFCGAKNVQEENIAKEGGATCDCRACWALALKLGRLRRLEDLRRARA